MKKKYRLRYDRIAFLLIAVAVTVTIIYYIIIGIISAVRWCLSPSTPDNVSRQDKVEVINVSPQQLKESHRMTSRIDSLMKQPMRLDQQKIAIHVFDLTTQQDVYTFHDRQLLPPASCMKLATAVAAMKRLGMDYQYRVSLLKRGVMKGDTLKGTVMLKADDDPMFVEFVDMAKKLRQQGVRHIKGQLYLSLAREDTLRAHPTAKVWDIPFNRTPPLLKGKKYVERQMRYALTAAGISLHHDPMVKSEGKYQTVATVTHPMKEVIIPMMRNSSNIKADALFYHLDYKKGLVSAGRRLTAKHDVETFWQEVTNNDSTRVMKGFVFNDGSGLSPDNRLTARFLTDILIYAHKDATIREFFIKEALATPGGERRGSLLSRLSQPELRGRVFCKTGTMTTRGGSSLAGYLHSYDGHWYAFSIINTDSPVAESRIFQDKLCKLIIKAK